MHRIVWPLIGLVILVTMQAAVAASRLGPPVEELQANPDRTRIAIAMAVKKPEPSRILFSVTQRLSGESPDEVLLRTDEETFADVEPGRSYVVAWSYLRRNRGVIGGWEEDPDGPSIVQVLGLGSTALFEDTPQIRLLFSPAANAGPDDAGRQLDALLAQMQREDVRSRGLVITELYLRPDLTAIMTASQAEVLQRVLEAQVLDPQHRDFLLRAALRLPGDVTSPWLAEVCRKVIILHGTQYDLSSFVPGLVRTAARGLQETGGQADLELLVILLYSNNPGVAKAALAAMNHLDPTATADKVEQALDRDWLQVESRHALQHYLDQSRMQTAQSSRDSG